MSLDNALNIAFDERGLAPCVVQDADTGAVLMLAWINADALRLTLESNIVHFWSRSRQEIWRKGDTSGNVLHLVELRTDCDRDAVLARVHPAGPACHTGTAGCFFVQADSNGNIAKQDDGIALPTAHVADQLAATIVARRDHSDGKKSYTRSLLDAGMPKIIEKIIEEQGELSEELRHGPDAKVIYETADLLFHTMVGVAARNIDMADVWSELGRRFGMSGLQEKASRSPK
jgi:phosphoribosyl-AMP cyclohydrolase / phosphoribosyl-ATP pyrophosphohydrolase